MPMLILIRGNSCSGKTTLAKSLQQTLGNDTLLLSQDTIRRDMLNCKDGPSSCAIPLLGTLIDYGFTHSSITILEGILRSDWYAPLFEKIVSLYGKNILAYYHDLSFKETVRRHATSPKANEFGAGKLEKWFREKDYISFIAERTISADLSVFEAKN